MSDRLKQLRAKAGLTQSKVAAAVGVSQPNYQRWEAGVAAIPADKIGKLAEALGTSEEMLTGRHKSIEVSIYDDDADDALSYYGEAAIHFRGAGNPLLLSISEKEFSHIYESMQSNYDFIVIRSLANEIVAIRVAAISDLYLSSEAFDRFGPKGVSYKDFSGVQIADHRDWEIIAALALDAVSLDEFADEDIKRVSEMVMITEVQWGELLADGRVKAEELKSEQSKVKARTKKIFSKAIKAVWQFSSGSVRRETVIDGVALYNAFYQVVEFGDHISDGDIILFAIEGRHRTAFISLDAVDFVSLPTHVYEGGRLLVAADDIDDDAAPVITIKQKSNPRRRRSLR